MRRLCAGFGCLVLVACGERSPGTAILERVDPAMVMAGAPADLILYGQGFGVRVKADFDDPRRSDVDAGYSAYLAPAGGGEIPLLAVKRLDDSRIAAVLPGGVTPGIYRIRVVDPWGHLARGDVSLEARSPTTQTSPCTSDVECDDGVACTTDLCTANGLCATRWACGPVDVKACFSVAPLAGTVETTFQFDASCAVGPAGTTFGFDFEGDGVFDVAPQAGRTASFRYPPGIYRPVVEVRSPLGATERAQLWVLVVPASELVVVDIALDEADVAATPDLPGGAGLSLREAIQYVNLTAAPKVITFTGQMEINISAAAFPPLTAAGARIVGHAGVVLNFAITTAGDGNCLTLAGSRQQLVGLEVKSCPVTALALLGEDSEVVDCTFRSTTGSGQAAIIEARGRFGPRNLVTGYNNSTHPVVVRASDAIIAGNRFSQNRGAIAILSGALRTAFELNELDSIANDAITVAGSATVSIRHNTFYQVTGTAIAGEISASGGEISVRGNILAGTPCALAGAAPKFAYVQPNLFPPNQSVCLGGTVGGNVLGSALFVDAASGDFRLLPGSPGIDASIDLGMDLNGAGAGDFDGAAPDFGAFESPY
jgi:hypothetical protein